MARVKQTALALAKAGPKKTILNQTRRSYSVPVRRYHVSVPTGKKNWARRRYLQKKVFGFKREDMRENIQKNSSRKKYHKKIPKVDKAVSECMNDLLEGVEIMDNPPGNFEWTYPQSLTGQHVHTKLTRVNYFNILLDV